MLTQTIMANVKATRTTSSQGGSHRTGTARMTLADARNLFGPPHDGGDGDKVTHEWHFDTPRGYVNLYDYWWNGPENNREAHQKLSIGSHTHKAALWLAAYLRRSGFEADANGRLL